MMTTGVSVSDSHDDGLALAEHFRKASLGYRGRNNFDAAFVLGFGSAYVLVSIKDGEVQNIRNMAEMRPLTSWDFGVYADISAWQDFWQAVPQPGSNDIFALARNKRLEIKGNILVLMQNLQFFKDVLALARAI